MGCMLIVLIYDTEGEHAEKYNLRYNPYSWNEAADMLFVEQPLHTGFSVAAKRGPRVYTEEDVGIHFRKFLLSFMEVFPEYKGECFSRDFITGTELLHVWAAVYY